MYENILAAMHKYTTSIMAQIFQVMDKMQNPN